MAAAAQEHAQEQQPPPDAVNIGFGIRVHSLGSSALKLTESKRRYGNDGKSKLVRVHLKELHGAAEEGQHKGFFHKLNGDYSTVQPHKMLVLVRQVVPTSVPLQQRLLVSDGSHVVRAVILDSVWSTQGVGRVQLAENYVMQWQSPISIDDPVDGGYLQVRPTAVLACSLRPLHIIAWGVAPPTTLGLIKDRNTRQVFPQIKTPSKASPHSTKRSAAAAEAKWTQDEEKTLLDYMQVYWTDFCCKTTERQKEHWWEELSKHLKETEGAYERSDGACKSKYKALKKKFKDLRDQEWVTGAPKKEDWVHWHQCSLFMGSRMNVTEKNIADSWSSSSEEDAQEDDDELKTNKKKQKRHKGKEKETDAQKAAATDTSDDSSSSAGDGDSEDTTNKKEKEKEYSTDKGKKRNRPTKAQERQQRQDKRMDDMEKRFNGASNNTVMETALTSAVQQLRKVGDNMSQFGYLFALEQQHQGRPVPAPLMAGYVQHINSHLYPRH